MARPSHWNSPTESVRLPAHLIPRLVEIAKTLDQPIPESEPDPLFQEYASFVQNLKPMMTTIVTSKGEERYLIDPDPISFDDFKLLKQMEADLEAAMRAHGLTRKEDCLMVFSRLVEEWGTPVKGGQRV